MDPDREPIGSGAPAGCLSRRDLSVRLVAGFTLCGGVVGCGGVTPIQAVMNLASAEPSREQAAPFAPEEQTSIVRASQDPDLRMTVPAYVNGKGPYAFVVDTGANISVISTALADELSAPAGRPAAVHGIAGAFIAPTAMIRTISVGAVTSVALVMPTMDVASLGGPGLVGVDILKNRIVQLDFRNHLLHIGPSRLSARLPEYPSPHGTSDSRIPRSEGADGVVAVPARYRFGQLTVVDADVDGLPIVAFLDSGSEATVGNIALLNGFSRLRPQMANRLRHVEILSATGQTADAELASLPSLRLGGLKIANVSAAFSDLHAFDIWGLSKRPAILVGMDVLRHFSRVELDFGGRQVRFYFAAGA